MAYGKILFTDIDAAIEEANFLAEKYKRKYVLVQEAQGDVWVARSQNGGDKIMYQTGQSLINHTVKWVAAPKELSLMHHHRQAGNRVWTAKERNHMNNRYVIDGPDCVAEHLGRSKNSVWDMAARMGITDKRRNGHYINGELKQILARIAG